MSFEKPFSRLLLSHSRICLKLLLLMVSLFILSSVKVSFENIPRNTEIVHEYASSRNVLVFPFRFDFDEKLSFPSCFKQNTASK